MIEIDGVTVREVLDAIRDERARKEFAKAAREFGLKKDDVFVIHTQLFTSLDRGLRELLLRKGTFRIPGLAEFSKVRLRLGDKPAKR